MRTRGLLSFAFTLKPLGQPFSGQISMPGTLSHGASHCGEFFEVMLDKHGFPGLLHPGSDQSELTGLYNKVNQVGTTRISPNRVTNIAMQIWTNLTICQCANAKHAIRAVVRIGHTDHFSIRLDNDEIGSLDSQRNFDLVEWISKLRYSTENTAAIKPYLGVYTSFDRIQILLPLIVYTDCQIIRA